jgi:hypothetical protein
LKTVIFKTSELIMFLSHHRIWVAVNALRMLGQHEATIA